jgi:hypothetical protein
VLTLHDPLKVKAASESAICAAGGEILETLPHIGLEELDQRSNLSVARRALVLHVLVNMSFGAPPRVGHEWLSCYGLLDAVSRQELSLLQGSAAMDEQHRNQLRWHIESLWAATWAGGLADDLSPTQPVQNSLASLFPSLRTAESPDSFLSRFHLRSLSELHEKLDLFYRAHWYARNCHLTGKDAGPFNLGVVQFRRQLLEWATHANVDWDHVDLST